MKAKKFLSVLLAIAVMVTSLLCCGVSASASTGKYPGAIWASDNLYVDGFWNTDGYYCVRIGNFGLIDYLSMFDNDADFECLNVWLWVNDYNCICLHMTYADGEITVTPYIDITGSEKNNYSDGKGEYYYLSDVIESARVYKNSDDDIGFVMYVPENSLLLDELADCTEVSLSSAMVLGSKQYFDYTLTVSANFEELESSVKDISTLTFSKISDKSYTGKALKPAVTIKDGDKKLVSGTDYTVSYKNNTKIGTATVTITGKGDYTGTKVLTFKIVPKKTTLSIKENSTSKVTLSWKKSAGAAGYQIYYSTNGGSYKKLTTVKSAATLSKVISKLDTSKNVYKFKIRPYAKSGSKTIYGSWSNVVSAG